ncbi:hypothetical protein DPMN_129991 [Dreissena polymorpha]|uniref:Uncharacterized protein n=1 Tax=Dreissena polymorpha TaxID=45954 RepID=A0A9D4H4B0_DREPO|nr:hypothetical protein DPMN_129991 [Dreissena polymorpha]
MVFVEQRHSHWQKKCAVIIRQDHHMVAKHRAVVTRASTPTRKYAVRQRLEIRRTEKMIAAVEEQQSIPVLKYVVMALQIH